MVVGSSTNAGANPRGERAATPPAVRNHTQGEHDHGGHVVPSAWNRAHLANSVERRVQQADCEVLPPESTSWVVPSRYRKNGATRATRPRSSAGCVQVVSFQPCSAKANVVDHEKQNRGEQRS